MQTFEEMTSELGSRLMVADNSTLFTATRLGNLIKDANFKATSYREWPELVKAKSTTTTTDDYYDYPEEFRTDSIIRLTIGGKKYDKKNYEDFLEYKDENSAYLLTNTAGLTMDIYGAIQAPDLVNPTDTTIFSKSDDTGNEAIVKLALSVALKKINLQLATTEETEANVILNNIWRKVASRQQRDERLNHPFLNVPDFFGPQRNMQVPTPEYIYAEYQRKIFIASFK